LPSPRPSDPLVRPVQSGGLIATSRRFIASVTGRSTPLGASQYINQVRPTVISLIPPSRRPLWSSPG